MVVMTHRSHGVAQLKTTPPAWTLFQVFSSYGAQPRTTMFGRNLSIGSDLGKRVLRSASDSSEMSNVGKASVNEISGACVE